MPVHDGCFNFSRRRIDLFQYIKMLSRLVASRKAGSCKQPLIRLPFWKLLLTPQFLLIQFIAKIFQGSLFGRIRQNKKKKNIAPSSQFKRGPPKVTINFIMHDWLSENMNSSWVIAEYNAIKPNYIVGHRFYPFF